MRRVVSAHRPSAYCARILTFATARAPDPRVQSGARQARPPPEPLEVDSLRRVAGRSSHPHLAAVDPRLAGERPAFAPAGGPPGPLGRRRSSSASGTQLPCRGRLRGAARAAGCRARSCSAHGSLRRARSRTHASWLRAGTAGPAAARRRTTRCQGSGGSASSARCRPSTACDGTAGRRGARSGAPAERSVPRRARAVPLAGGTTS